jgi:hypothetical protein
MIPVVVRVTMVLAFADHTWGEHTLTLDELDLDQSSEADDLEHLAQSPIWIEDAARIRLEEDLASSEQHVILSALRGYECLVEKTLLEVVVELDHTGHKEEERLTFTYLDLCVSDEFNETKVLSDTVVEAALFARLQEERGDVVLEHLRIVAPWTLIGEVHGPF